jgi:Sulfotransferase family
MLQKAVTQTADTITAAFAALRGPLAATELITRAQRRMNLVDFGSTPFQEPLEKLLRACREEAELSLFGRFATRWDTVRFLSNLLRLREEERRAPKILEERIERPIFIAGLPRSGTTFLHSLLAEDDTNLVPRIWQLIHPYPIGPGSDQRPRRVSRQLRMFGMLAPEFRRMHPIDASSPQECSEITAHIFASLRFDTTYHVPSYRRWLDETGHLDAYRFHKLFLQHLQHQAGLAGRWVLKCPDHIFALDALRAVYPDAGVVFVHRDPLAVLPSVTRLTEVLRRPFTRRVDKLEIGRQDSDRWLAATKLMTEAADAELFEEPILHIHYLDLVSDPLETVATLYRHFGRALDPHTATRISRLVAAKPNGGYATRRSQLEEYGLDPVAERYRYAQYVERFGIRPERPVKSVKGSAALVPGRSAEATKKGSPANPRGDTVAPDALLAARLESTRR